MHSRVVGFRCAIYTIDPLKRRFCKNDKFIVACALRHVRAFQKNERYSMQPRVARPTEEQRASSGRLELIRTSAASTKYALVKPNKQISAYFPSLNRWHTRLYVGSSSSHIARSVRYPETPIPAVTRGTCCTLGPNTMRRWLTMPTALRVLRIGFVMRLAFEVAVHRAGCTMCIKH